MCASVPTKASSSSSNGPPFSTQPSLSRSCSLLTPLIPRLLPCHRGRPGRRGLWRTGRSRPHRRRRSVRRIRRASGDQRADVRCPIGHLDVARAPKRRVDTLDLPPAQPHGPESQASAADGRRFGRHAHGLRLSTCRIDRAWSTVFRDESESDNQIRLCCTVWP